MAATISIDIKGLLPLKRQMQLIAMPKSMRRRLLFRTAKKVIQDSKKRVRSQVDLDGKPYAARKRKRSRKMLSKLAKQLKVIRNDSLQALVGFSTSIVGRIAAKQQHGHVERISATSLKKRNKGTHNDPATRRQAIALREAGFTIKANGSKRMKRPSLKWITQNMKVGQAGAALRWLREQNGEQVKQNWTTVLPARSFLGATAAEVSRHIETIFKQVTQEIAHVAR